MRVTSASPALRACQCLRPRAKVSSRQGVDALTAQLRRFSVTPKSRAGETENAEAQETKIFQDLPRGMRIVPASPSYFTGRPGFTDSMLHIQSVLKKYEHLPVATGDEVQHTSWITLSDYRGLVRELVLSSRYANVLNMVKRLNKIHPAVMPEEVASILRTFRRNTGTHLRTDKIRDVDEYGRAYGAGRRKSSTARVWLVQGEGEVLVNGKLLPDIFTRVHDRESAMWPLRITERFDKYNVWAAVSGGGTTGQAEALTLALAKALMVVEPALKPALRRGGCITRDPRRVERKKPGKLKARKMPAWIKR